MTKPSIKITAILGALILLAGGVFHMSALAQVKDATQPIDSYFYRNALPAMWMIPALHWIFIAFLSIGLSRYRSNACAAILMAFGLWILVDALMTFIHVGAFIGVYMLTAAGLLLLVSGVMLRQDMKDA